MEADQRLLEVEWRLVKLRDAIESENGLVRLDTALLDLIGCMEKLTEWAKGMQAMPPAFVGRK